MNGLGNHLLTVIVLFVLGVVGYVVFIGGILVVKEHDYTFDQYLTDLTRLHALLIAAVFGAIARAVVPLLDRRNGKEGTDGDH